MLEREEIVTDDEVQESLNGLKITLTGWYESQADLTDTDMEHVERDRYWGTWSEEFKAFIDRGYKTGRYGVTLRLEAGLTRGREFREVGESFALFDLVYVEGPVEINLDYIEKHQTPQEAVGERPIAAIFSDVWQFYVANGEQKVAFSLLQLGEILANERGDLKLTS